MTQLPIGWTQTTLGAVATTQAGFGFPPDLQGRDTGDLPFAKVGDISRAIQSGVLELTGAANYINRSELAGIKAKTLPAGTTVFAKIGEAIRLNRRAITTSELVVDNNVMGLIPDRRQIDPRFLLHFMRTVDLYPLAGATTVPSIRASVIQSLPILLPTLPQQERIVEKLEAVQARSRRAREALEAVPPLLEKLRQSILAAAFRGDLTKEWRAKHPDVEPATELLKRIRVERRKKWEEAELAKMTAKGKVPGDDRWKAKYKEPAPVDPNGLPELPKGWCWASLDEIAVVVTGGTPPADASDTYAGEVPFFKPTDLDAGRDLTKARQYLSAKGLSFVELIPAESVLVTCIGATIGKTGFTRVPCATNQQINAATPVVIAASYLYWWIVGPVSQSWIRANASATTLPIINKGRFLGVPVPIAPDAERVLLAAQVEKADSAISSALGEARASSIRLNDLERASLAKAFRGELILGSMCATCRGNSRGLSPP